MSGHSGQAAPRSQPLCPSTDSPSLPLITRMPVSHLSAAPTDLRAVGSQQLSGFRLCEFKSTNSSGRTNTHQWGSCVSSCPDAACLRLCVREREKKKKGFLQTGQCRHVRLYQILSLGLSFCGVTTDSFSTKALVKERETSVTAPLTCHYRLVLRPGVEGFSFSFCTIILSSVIFIRSATHQRNISLEAFITYETGGGES